MMKIRKPFLIQFVVGIFLISGCSLLPPAKPVVQEVKQIPEAPSRELRGIWLTRFEYCHYSKTHDQDSIRTYISDIIDSAAIANINAVFFQVRGSGDAYYQSDLEPWGPLLTDTLGKDPGWDPLAFAIRKAHGYGMELYAWMNTFPAWRGSEPPMETTPPSPYLTHPEWLVADTAGNPMPLNKGYVTFSPTIPGVQDYVISIAKDIVSRYNVDGIHFDYIRYPEGTTDKGYSHDSITVSLFNDPKTNPYRLDWSDWERQQLDHFVARLYNAITDIKPELRVSAAVIGSYRRGRWNAYGAVYQDPQQWTEWGKMDFIVPMIYWPRSHPTQPFLVRSREYKNDFTVDRYLFPGIGSYRYVEENKPSYTWAETEGEIDDLRRGNFPGMVFFNAGSLIGHFKTMGQNRFRTPAGIPPLTWKDDQPPQAPRNLHLDQKTLFWDISPDSEAVYRYMIYSSNDTIIDTTRGTSLAAIVPGDSTHFDFENIDSSITIGVTAVDSAWNESPVVILKNKN